MDQGNHSHTIIGFPPRRLVRLGRYGVARLRSIGAGSRLMGMNTEDSNKEAGAGGGKVIGFTGKRVERPGAISDAGTRTASNTRVIAITSGKGGVGKTNIVANLGFALSQMGTRVLILDADLGLGNLDILLGITPKYNLSHVVNGERIISEVTVDGPGGMLILPAASGIQEVTHLTHDQRNHLLNELQLFTKTIDVMLIDTAAGVSSNVMYFNTAADEVMVVVSPEPTSMTDAYALMKILSLKYGSRQFKLLVNIAADKDEAYEVFRQLKMVSNRFLDISIDYLGYILHDKNVPRCVRHQKVICELFPETEASQCFYALARKLYNSPAPAGPRDSRNNFWRNIFPGDGDTDV